MALIKTPDYKTGANWFNRAANFTSYIPGLSLLLTPIFGTIGTIIDSGKWLLRGKLLSAATAATTGTVATFVNASSGAIGYNIVSGLATGKTLGSNVRVATEWGIGGITGAIGKKPQVLQSYTAGIGSIGGAASGPGQFASGISAQRGQDPNAAYANYMRGEGGVHVNQLQSANGRGA
jgi:hypothetical protein